DRDLPQSVREASQDLVPEPPRQAQKRRQKRLPQDGLAQLQVLVVPKKMTFLCHPRHQKKRTQICP
ncbi:hypothetical protein M9458_010329, partial [Cirrhinus mrigala]